MNTNDLPPAARLAALIEAGRAAYPSLKHEGAQCAMFFAMLGAGCTPDSLRIARVRVPHTLTRAVICMNDETTASLADICLSLREGELAKVSA